MDEIINIKADTMLAFTLNIKVALSTFLKYQIIKRFFSVFALTMFPISALDKPNIIDAKVIVASSILFTF